MDIEVWKDIPGYENLYQVSSLGRIASLFFKNNLVNKKDFRIKKSTKDKDGYLLNRLTKDGKAKTYKVHRIVASVFLENKGNKPQVNHINSIRDDNRVDNLEWCTIKENITDYISKGRKRSYKRAIFQKDFFGNIINEWESATQVEKILGYDQGNIVRALKDNSIMRYGFYWCYK